jgi:hypothetical protein
MFAQHLAERPQAARPRAGIMDLGTEQRPSRGELLLLEGEDMDLVLHRQAFD